MIDFDIEMEDALRSLPEDLKDTISMEPVAFLDTASRLHQLMSYWSVRMAYAKGKHNMAKVGLKIGAAKLSLEMREILAEKSGGKRVTEGQIEECVMLSPTWATLWEEETAAEVEFMKLKGMV